MTGADSPDVDARASSALADPVYRHYLAARAVVMAGNALTMVALPVLAYRLTGSATLTALLATAETAPYLIVGLPAGALVDRWHRRRVLVVTAVLSGLALLSIPLTELWGVLTYAQLVTVATVVATLYVFSDAATFGVVPQMVGRERVASATSTLVTVGTALGMVGPLVGGLLIATLPAAWVLGIDAAGYLLAAAVLARLRWAGSEDRPGRTRDPAARRPQLRAEIGEGLRYIWAMPVVRWLTVLGTGNSLAGGAVTGLLVVIGVEQLGLADDSPRLGWLFVAFAIGTFVASLALPRLQRRVGVGLITTTGYAVALAAVLGLSTARTVPMALSLLVVLSFASTTLIVNGIVARQVVTPDRLQSRVNTTARLIAWGGSPLGAAIGGLVAGAVGTEWALRVAAVGLLISLAGAAAAGVPRFPLISELPTGDLELDPAPSGRV